MARSTSRSGGGRRSGGGGSTRKPEVAEVEVVEESAGMGVEAGVSIMTCIVLLVAILMVDYDRGVNYGEGALFKGKYAEAMSDAANSPSPAPATADPEEADSGE